MPKKSAKSKKKHKAKNKPTEHNFTPLQERFIDEYVVDLNATKAAARAGYSEKAARQQGSTLLSNPYILDKIAEKRKEISKKTLVSIEYVINGLKQVVEKSLREEEVLDRDGNAVAMRFDSSGANKAFELLGKHIGAFDGRGKGSDVKPRLVMTIQGSDEKAD